MYRQLRALEQRADRQQQRGSLQRAGHRGQRLGSGDGLVNLQRAELLAYQYDSGEQAHVSHAAGDELFVRSHQCLRPGVEKSQQAMQRQTGTCPGQR